MEEFKPVLAQARHFELLYKSFLFVLPRFFDKSRYCNKEKSNDFST